MSNVELLVEVSKLVMSLMGVVLGVFVTYTLVLGWVHFGRATDHLSVLVLERYKFNPVVVWSCTLLLNLLILGFLLCCNAYTIGYFVINFPKWFYA